MMNEIFLPVFHHFENGNVFTGSLGAFRYQISPNVVMRTQKEVDLDASSIKAEYWHGLLGYEHSQIEGEKTFPMSHEGWAALRRWLQENV